MKTYCITLRNGSQVKFEAEYLADMMVQFHECAYSEMDILSITIIKKLS